MRSCLYTVLAVSLVGCSPSAAPDINVVDDRFDLIRFNMPDVLVSDAKKCVKISGYMKGQKFSSNALVQKASEQAMSFWRVVDLKLMGGAGVKDVLPFGGDAETVETILPTGFGLPFRNSEPCAEYAGGMIVEIGIISLSESIEMALATDPDMFDDMGMTVEDIEAGLEIIAGQAKQLDALPVSDRVACTAISHVEKREDPSRAPYASIWTAALTSAIERGELAATEIRQQSVFWQEMAVSGVDGLTGFDGLEVKAEACNAWLDDAIQQEAATR